MTTFQPPHDDRRRDGPPEGTDWSEAPYDSHPDENERGGADRKRDDPRHAFGDPADWNAGNKPADAETPRMPEPTISVGSVLSRTVSVISQSPGLFIVLGILIVMPNIFMNPEAYRTPGWRFLARTGVSSIQLLFQGCIAYGVYQVLRGERAGLASALGRGLSRIVPILIAALILGILKTFGYLLLIIPGIVMTCVWAVTIPACVVERLGPIKSMDRSAELTRGNGWSIFGLFTILFVLTVLLIFAVGFIGAYTNMNGALGTALTAFVLFFPLIFEGVMCAVLYYDLRAAKEGVTVDKLANVFD